MGKDKKKDKKKQGKGAEKTAAKTAKNAAKREKKERAKSGEADEEDIEAILAELAARDKQRVAVTETACERPSPRVHASFVLNPAKDKEFLVFGGEYYNGARVFVYNDLFRAKENRGELTWSQITSPNAPKPRSSHQAVATRSHMYVIGGEFTSPSQMQFYHHKDMWRLDLASSQWEEVSIKGGPTPRSGHRAVLWRSSIFVFGGFYDTGVDVKYYNDAYLFDIPEQRWTKLGEDKKGDNGMWPAPRSAVGLAVYDDTIFLYGGFTKTGRCLSSSDDSRGTIHVDVWAMDLSSKSWSKVRRAGIPPTPRCGFSTAVHKRRNLIVFGGVLDEYDKHDLISTFYNDVYVFRMDQRRWFPLVLRGAGKKKGPRRNKDGKSSCSGWSSASMLSDLDAFDVKRENEDDEEYLGRKALRKAMRRAAIRQTAYLEGDYVLEEDDNEAHWSGDEDDTLASTAGAGCSEHAAPVDGEERGRNVSDISCGDELGAARGEGVGDRDEGAVSADELAAAVGSQGDQEPRQAETPHAPSLGGDAGSLEEQGKGELSWEGLLQGLTLTPKQSAEEQAAAAAAEEEERNAEAAVAAEEGVTRPRKRINAHVLVQGNDLVIYGGKVDHEKVEVTLDDVWSVDLSKLVEYKCVLPLSDSASVWMEEEEEEEEDEGDGSVLGSDDEPPEDWNSEEDEVDAEDEGGASSDGDQEDDEDDEEDEDKEDEEEKQKRLEIERKKEEGRRRKEAAKREKAAVSVGDSAVTAAHGQQSPRGDSAHSSCQSAGWQDSMAALEDEALVAVFTTGACAALDLKELLFLRERDPMRFLDVTMRIKAQRSKTSEEEEQQRLEEAQRADMAAAIAAKARLLSSSEARLQRGLELRRELQQYPEESTPKINESLKDFFDRSVDYWTITAHELLETTGKKMRRDAFNLASQHHAEVQPLLAELSELVRLEELDAASPSATGAAKPAAGTARGREHK